MKQLNQIQPQASKKPQQRAVNTNIVESLKDIPTSVGSSLVDDVAGRMPTDILTSLLGQNPALSGELKQHQEIPVPSPENMPRFRREQPQPVRLQELGLKEKIDAVRQELAALAVSVKSLNTELEKTVSETPVDPGIYHLSFFERIRSILVMLRTEIDSSRTWLQTSSSRKSKRGYWGMYKKHGTTFGLSSERTLATQAG